MNIAPEIIDSNQYRTDSAPIPDDSLKAYREMFAPSQCTPFGINRAGPEWRTITDREHYLTDNMLSRHLAGDYYVGPINKVFTQTLAIDIDAHDEESARTLDRRTADVMGAFPEAAPMAFSTPRGGRHLHYVLERRCWSDQARGFALDRLKEHKVKPQSGQVEVFPTGKPLRAPLGRGCYLLDPQTMDPVDGHRDANLDVMADILQGHHYDTLSIPPSYRATQAPAQSTTGRRRRSGASGGEYMVRVARMLGAGIGPGETNGPDGCLLTLRWYFFVVYGWSADRVAHELVGYMETLGQASRTWQRSPEQVKRKIHSLVHEDWDPAKVAPMGHRKATRRHSTAIADYVAAQPLDSRERAFLEKVLVRAHCRGEHTLDGQIDVQIPSDTLKGYHWQYGPIIKRLKTLGYIELARNYTTLGRCNTYRVPCLDRYHRHSS